MSILQRRTVVAFLCAAVAAMSGADARPLHHPRHTHRHIVRGPAYRPYAQPVYVAPGGPPLYSTCDRINADRMLVGTCR